MPNENCVSVMLEAGEEEIVDACLGVTGFSIERGSLDRK